MHRPDTIIEIHRERVQDQTVEVFGGDKYTESVDGTGYSATATLDLTLDRVWFILDSQRRLWQGNRRRIPGSVAAFRDRPGDLQF